MPYLSPQAKRDKAKRDLKAAKTPARRKLKKQRTSVKGVLLLKSMVNLG